MARAKKPAKTTIKCKGGECCVYDKRSGKKLRCFTPKRRKK